MHTKEDVTRAIEQSWSAFTRADRKWNPENPALGQSDVTAWAIRDLLGGEIMHETVVLDYGERRAHYSNIVDGKVLDLTRRQYSESAVFEDDKQPVDRGEIKDNYSLSLRYSLLRDHIELYVPSQTTVLK